MCFDPGVKIFYILLLLGAFGSAHAQFSCEETDSVILLKRGDKTILQYNKVPTAEAAKHEPFYTRSGYIHPVYSPSGKEVTGDYSPDHKHQHGLFFAWTKTKFEKRKPEFWNQKLEAGNVAYLKTLAIVNEGTTAGFDVEHLWEDLTAEGEPKPVLIETWKVRAEASPEDEFVFTVESSLECATDSPLTVEKYHYGGMAFRGSTQWMPEKKDAEPKGEMQTSDGLGREEGNHSRPEWVAMWGPVDDGVAGVAVTPDPENFRGPQWVRLHPSMPYFVFAPMVEESFRIVPGKPYVSRYRYAVFDGEFSESVVSSQ